MYLHLSTVIYSYIMLYIYIYRFYLFMYFKKIPMSVLRCLNYSILRPFVHQVALDGRLHTPLGPSQGSSYAMTQRLGVGPLDGLGVLRGSDRDRGVVFHTSLAVSIDWVRGKKSA